MTQTIPTSDTTGEALVNARLDTLLAEHRAADTAEFLGAMYDLGLANVSFPEGFGGLGVSPGLQRTVVDRVVAAGGPAPRVSIGLGMAAPTIGGATRSASRSTSRADSRCTEAR